MFKFVTNAFIDMQIAINHIQIAYINAHIAHLRRIRR